MRSREGDAFIPQCKSDTYERRVGLGKKSFRLRAARFLESFSRAAKESPRRSCSLEESSVSNEHTITNTRTALSHRLGVAREKHGLSANPRVDPLGWQSRTMGARTDSDGKKWYWR